MTAQIRIIVLSLLGFALAPWSGAAEQKPNIVFIEADDRPEKQNVAAGHPEIVARLSKMVLEWKSTLPKAPPAGCRVHTAPEKAGQQ